MILTAEAKETRSMLLERTKALAPLIASLDDQMEQERRMPAALVRAFLDAGLFKLWIPKSLGGYEVDPVTFMEIVEEVSRVSGAAGWNLMLGSSFGVYGGLLPKHVAREIYVDTPDAILAGQINATNGAATEVDGGYRLKGHWAFGSGILQAKWVISNAYVHDGPKQRVGASGNPVEIFCIVPASDCQILDTWHTMGLCGTGSNDYSINDAFVPFERTMPRSSGPRYENGALYRFPNLVGPPLAGPSIGIAYGALDAVKSMFLARRMRSSGRLASENEILQHEIARAQGIIEAGQASLHGALAGIWDVLDTLEFPPQEMLSKLNRSRIRAMLNSTEAVDILFNIAGGSAVYKNRPLERRFRDIHTARQHTSFGVERMQQEGVALLAEEARRLSTSSDPTTT